MDDEHENDDENNDDSRIERDAPTGELPHGVDAARAGKPVPADEKPSRDVNDRPGENGEGQGETRRTRTGKRRPLRRTRQSMF